MQFPFFRKEATEEDELFAGPESSFDDDGIDLLQWDRPFVAPSTKPSNPVHKAVIGQIGLVSLDTTPQLPAPLSEFSSSSLMKRIQLPRNPRIASDELYEIDGMDYIIMLSDKDKWITKDLARWVMRLKPMAIPMIVVIPDILTSPSDKRRLTLLEQRIGVPVIPIGSENVESAWQQFIATTMELMPAMGLALAAHLPALRSTLNQNLLSSATSESVVIQDAASLQKGLVAQMCAAHGLKSTQIEANQEFVISFIKIVRHYTQRIVERLPIKDQQRKARFVQAVSTLLIGHMTTIHLGENPPSLRKDLLPQIWRLYRASRQTHAV